MTHEKIEKEMPDVIIIATGAFPMIPEKIIKGKGLNIMSADEAMIRQKEIGN